MMKLINKIKEMYHLSYSDESILAYVIENIDYIPDMSSHQLAKDTFTSPATIVRFCKKLQFNSYADFRYNISNLLKNMQVNEMNVTSNENIISILQKSSQLEFFSITRTKDLMNIDQLSKLIDDINRVKYIDIIAYDANAKLGDYFSHLMIQVGKISNVYQNTDQQLHLSLNANQDHLVFILSKHARNKRLVKMTKMLNQKHINTVYIGGLEENVLSKLATYVFKTPFVKESEKEMEIVYFTSVKYIFDLIYCIMISKNYDLSKNTIDSYNEIFF